MKLATFVGKEGTPRIGSVDPRNGTILDLQHAATCVLGAPEPAFDSMLALIAAGEPALAGAQRLMEGWCEEATVDLAAIQLLAPIPVPPRMRDSICFLGHLKGAFERIYQHQGKIFTVPDIWYKRPVYYQCNSFSVVGSDTDVVWPSYCHDFDYELELACVIGKPGKDLTPDTAKRHIFGYTIFNDFSARDILREELILQLGPSKGKDFDTGNAVGPWIVTADEIGDPQNLDMRVRLNGVEQGSGKSSGMHHGFVDIVAFMSDSHSLLPGEIIASGTADGCSGLEQGRMLQDGDVVELEIDGIGVLRNRVVRPRHAQSPDGSADA